MGVCLDCFFSVFVRVRVCVCVCACVCVHGCLCASQSVKGRKAPSVLCNFHRSELTMATLIEKLWRCKSANGGRQNNCPPTGPHTLPQKRGI